MATTEEILDAIGGMTVLELSELKKAFEERFDVTAAAPAAVMAAPAAATPVALQRRRSRSSTSSSPALATRRSR
jgi:large subunit ribosomal protein L7/L12